jgi:hypothetical protein
MKISLWLGTVAAAVLTVVASEPVYSSAQSQMVTVDITAVKADIARKLGVNVDDIEPNVVETPPRVAADVCAVTEDFLKRLDEPQCSAKGTSEQLDALVRMLIEQ